MGTWPSYTDAEDERGLSVSFSAREKAKIIAEGLFLRPADRGSHAWLFLLASFFIEGLALGFPGAYGVFQEYYSTHEPFEEASGLPAVATCATGIMYLGMPLMMGTQRLFPRLSLWSPLLGVLIMSISLIAASFATIVPHLIVTQGMLFAIGSSLSYCPCIAYLNEWFDKRKGMAYGIMWAGTGLSGSVLPFILEYLLVQVGFRSTLRLSAAAIVIITVPLMYFVKPRIPPQLAKADVNPFNFKFTLSQTFMLHQLANVIQALGFFLPTIYLPTYARSVLGAGQFGGASTLLLTNVASTIGCPAMGWLSDKLHVTTCLFIATFGAAIATFFLWGFAMHLTTLLVFCTLYGLFAGSYTSAWTGLMRQVTADSTLSSRYDSETTDPVMVLAVLAAGRGVGSILSGPLSQTLVEKMPWRGEAMAAYGTGYGPTILFTATTATLSGIVIFWRYIGWIK